MKTCKKLFSLLLVAVMLVAAIPFAAMAAPINETVSNPKVVAVCNGAKIAEGVYDADFVPAFDPDVSAHVDQALAGSHLSIPAAYTRDNASFDSATKTLTINYTLDPGHTHDLEVTGKGDANGHTVKCKLAGCTYAGVVGHDASGEATKAIPAVAATCGQNGHEAATEYACGYTVGGAVIPATGAHNFQNGTCTVCGATDPNWKGTTGGGSGSTPTTPTNPTTPTTPAETTYTTVTVNIDGKLYDSYSVNYKKAGELQKSDASAILTATGKSFDLTKYSVKNVAANGTAITVDLETIPYAGWTLKVTDGSTTKTYTKDSYTGSLTNVSEIMTAFGATKDFTIANYETASVANNGKNFTVTLVTKPTANDIYTVNVAINGNQYASKSNVTYRGTFGSNATDAQAILSAAKIDGVTASNYEKITVTKSSNNVISIDLRNVVTIKVYNNASTFTNTEMEIGRPYVNYLGTNIINNSTFGGITVKDNSGASRFYTASQVTGGTAVVNANDVEVTIQRNGDSCTLNFLRSDGTVLESRKLYAGDQIGTLPSYTVGGVPATWTYNGKPISATDVYNFKTTSVNIVPYFGGISDVYVDVYINGNVKTMQTRVKVTDLVQKGVLYLNSDVKGAIASALRNSSNKNLTYTAFFDASTWSDFIKTKNTNGAAEPYRVGDNSERQGAVYLYVMVNNATVKATDSTNPKTGDNVKLGAAAAILAVAVVGFGAVVVINKKKGVQ